MEPDAASIVRVAKLLCWHPRRDSLEDAVAPEYFEGRARRIAEAAKQHGFCIYAAEGKAPVVYQVGIEHDCVSTLAEPPDVPMGRFLATLLDELLLAPQDIMLVEGMQGHEHLDILYDRDLHIEAYLLANRKRIKESGVVPRGIDNESLCEEQRASREQAHQAEQRGDHDARWKHLKIAAERFVQRDLRHAEYIFEREQGHYRSYFIIMGHTHALAGTIQDEMKKAGKPYMVLVQRERQAR